MTGNLEYSRPAATAARLTQHAEDSHRFLDKHVLLTGEPGTLATANGRDCLISSLRLVVRTCRNVSVLLPQELSELLAEVRAVATRVAFGAPVQFLSTEPDLTAYDAILSVGTIARPTLPWTVINSNGWLARVSSGPTSLSGDCTDPNPIAALAAASLGSAEVFKRLLRLRPARGAVLDSTSFSLHSYRTGEDDAGPAVPSELWLDGVLVGAGAIGNAVVYLVGRLPIAGRLAIVDRDVFRPENLGTCLLVGPPDLGTAKAEFSAARLGSQLETRGYVEDIGSFANRLGTERPYPSVIVNGLDNISARHDVQRLWPQLVIDGAIGDFACQVSRHPWGEDIGCLLCLFREPQGERAECVQSRATGLRPMRTQQALTVVTEEDVAAAPAEKQAWLRARIGRQVCSVVQEAVAQQLSEEKQRAGFAPSVPFVACLSAAMAASELIKYLAGWPSPLEPRFQMDVLRGPALGQELPQERRRDCTCVTRRLNIEKIRARRMSTTAAS